MRRWLAIAAVSTLVGCGQAQGTSAPPGATHSPSATLKATANTTPTATAILQATDSYPSAPQVGTAYLGNGVYGNALLVSGAETWYWDGAVWHHANARMPEFPHTPPVFDPVLHKSVMLTNGDTGEPVDTWAWAGSGWSNLSASPPGETGPSLLGFNAATQQLIALVTSSWRFDGTAWQPAGGQDSPQSRIATSMAYDPLTRQLVIFGGISYQSRQGMADTWTWDGQTWTQRHPATTPPAGVESLAYDPDTKQLLLLDQETPSDISAPRSLTMWNWDGTDWHQLHPAILPPLGIRPSMTFDLANHQLLYVEGTFQGGLNGAGGSQTWVYANATWQRVG